MCRFPRLFTPVLTHIRGGGDGGGVTDLEALAGFLTLVLGDDVVDAFHVVLVEIEVEELLLHAVRCLQLVEHASDAIEHFLDLGVLLSK